MKKTILITGASGGIGLALAKAFLAHNYIVIGTYCHSPADLKQLSNDYPSDFFYYQCDLSDFVQAEHLLQQIKDDHHTIDILINNAGISRMGLLQDLSACEWNTLWNTNVTSAVALSGQVIPMFLQKGSGKIINISSVWGNHGASYEVAYSTTKGALNTFTKALAKELAPSNIQVNAISCGMIDTKMNAHLSPEDVADIISEIPASRIGTPEDVANAVLAIINAGLYLTGQIINVDGGWQI